MRIQPIAWTIPSDDELMALPISVSMLRAKRGQIRDTISAHEAKPREAQADLAHVLATLRLFEASGEPADFTPYFDPNPVFRRGEKTSCCIAALEAERPLATRQPTQHAMGAKVVDAHWPDGYLAPAEVRLLPPARATRVHRRVAQAER